MNTRPEVVPEMMMETVRESFAVKTTTKEDEYGIEILKSPQNYRYDIHYSSSTPLFNAVEWYHALKEKNDSFLLFTINMRND